MIELGACQRMNSRISPRQCDINRKGIASGPPQSRRAPCLSCQGCPGLVDVQATVYELPAPAAPEPTPQPVAARPPLPPPRPEKRRQGAIPAQRRSIYDPTPEIAAQILRRVQILMKRKES